MNREKLETYLGKEVTVTTRDGDTATGILIKGDVFESNYYSCRFNESGGRVWFRLSYIAKVKEAGEKKKGVEQQLKTDTSCRLSKF